MINFFKSNKSHFTVKKMMGFRGSSGMTFMEVIIMIAIISVIMATGMKANQNVQFREKFENTLLEMQQIKKAIVGNSELKSDGIRNDFGYVGEMGRLPTALTELMSIGAQSAGLYSSTLHITSGWEGPYLQESFTNFTSGPLTDEFDRTYEWDLTEVPNSGDTISARIISRGADKATGGTGIDQDITLEIFKREWRGNITGKAFDSAGKKLKKATVKVYFQNGSGGIGTKTTTTNAKGIFSVYSLPFGPKSFSFTPLGGAEAPPRQLRIDLPSKILPDVNNIGSILLAGSSVAGPSNNIVNVQLTNNLGKDVTVNDWKAIFSPGVFYDIFKIGNATHWSSTTPKAGDGDLLSSIATFTPYNFVNSTTITFQMRVFTDSGGGSINMTGNPFTITMFLSSGVAYEIAFTPL